MNNRTLALTASLSLFATASFADDASYCKDLNTTARGVTPGAGVTVPTDVAAAMAKCDADGIKVLEKYITDNKGTLPKRM
jgi:hypothetical protein